MHNTKSNNKRRNLILKLRKVCVHLNYLIIPISSTTPSSSSLYLLLIVLTDLRTGTQITIDPRLRENWQDDDCPVRIHQPQWVWSWKINNYFSRVSIEKNLVLKLVCELWRDSLTSDLMAVAGDPEDKTVHSWLPFTVPCMKMWFCTCSIPH